MNVRWLTAFLDTPGPSAGVAEEFWGQLTGTSPSERHGAQGEFAILRPDDGDAFLRVQRVGGGAPSCHLDVHVKVVRTELAYATDLGATVVRDYDAWVVLASPGEFAFCLVPYHDQHRRPAPVRWSGGQHSLLDQLCLDVPPELFQRETEFWSALTGWEKHAGSLPEFSYLQRPAGIPLRLLLQRLDDAEPQQPVRAHVDFACDDIETEAQRHIELGATFVRRNSWITLRDPVGREYCVTARNPFTAKLT